MELWDIFGHHRNPPGQIHRRGTPLGKNACHLVTQVWIVNSRGDILLTQRHPDKSYGRLWECTGGAVQAGEDTYTASLREVCEEIGVDLSQDRPILVRRDNYTASNTFCDIWLYHKDVDLAKTTLQSDEVIGIRWVSYREFLRMVETGEAIHSLIYFKEIYHKYCTDPAFYADSFSGYYPHGSNTSGQ